MKTSRVISIFFAVALLVACVSSPEQPQAQTGDWIFKTPAPDGTYTYFVGSGSHEKGDSTKALEIANANLLSSIMAFIGVKVSAESTAIAKATLDQYQTDITSTVNMQSTNRVAGFLIKDRKETKDKSGRVMVYILAAYETKELEKEKARIAAIFKEKDDAVAKPESAGIAAESTGRYFDAVRSYIEAAVAASGSDIDNAAIKMERNVNNARRVLQKLRLIKATVPVVPSLGQDFRQPFAAKIVFGESDSGPGIPGVDVFVIYQRRQAASGRTVTKTERAVSDPAGLVSFTPPAPDFVGKTKLTMRLNLDSSLDLLDSFPARFETYRQALETELRGRSVDFEYVVGSKAREISVGVAIVDLDEKGTLTAGASAQGGLVEAMLREKFKVQSVVLDPVLVSGMDDSAVLGAAKPLAGKIGRLVYGVARIETVAKDGGSYLATAKATVRCVDLSTGTLLYAVEKTFMAVGSDEASARRAALLQIGRDTVATDLMANLP